MKIKTVSSLTGVGGSETIVSSIVRGGIAACSPAPVRTDLTVKRCGTQRVFQKQHGRRKPCVLSEWIIHDQNARLKPRTRDGRFTRRVRSSSIKTFGLGPRDRQGLYTGRRCSDTFFLPLSSPLIISHIFFFFFFFCSRYYLNNRRHANGSKREN